MRFFNLPPLVVYLAAGVPGLTGIVGTFFSTISLRNFWRCPVIDGADDEVNNAHPAHFLGLYA
jgi:hypothetical protein